MHVLLLNNKNGSEMHLANLCKVAMKVINEIILVHTESVTSVASGGGVDFPTHGSAPL
jgi:hypothetical protein